MTAVPTGASTPSAGSANAGSSTAGPASAGPVNALSDLAPVQVRAEVLAIKRIGSYFAITLVAPGVAERFRPGQFVTTAVGGAPGEPTAMLLRRAFSVYRASARGTYGSTIEIVVAAHGPGTHWLTRRQRHDQVLITGPLGRPFALPRTSVGQLPAHTVLVGGGYGAAPLFALADSLRERGCRVDMIIGAASQDRLFGALEAKRASTAVAITTEDGSIGQTGRVTDALPAMLERYGGDVIYACGPMPMLAAVAGVAAKYGIASQCLVEEAMACGIGVCMTCVLPVIGNDGVTRMVRSCVEGPAFPGDRVRWNDVGSIPDDCWGAPTGGHR